ncbi:MAG: tetratricopeptide repeat protein [Kiritimatiellae bacterium]|nr:tetratricopeptide repeat protein [Kiritimatiellia bacterium]
MIWTALLTATTLLAATPVSLTSDLLADSRTALEDELYDIAHAKLTHFLQQATTPEERREGILLLAQTLYGQKRYQDMFQLLEQNRKLADGSRQADAFEFWLAMASFEQGQWPQVVEICRRLDQQYPLSTYRSRAMRLQAWSLVKQGQTNAAVTCFARLAEQYQADPEGPAYRLDWAETLINAGQISAAREVLEHMPVINPETRTGQEYLSMLGRIYLNEHAWDKARNAYTPLATLRNVPEEYRAMALLALAEIAVAQTNMVEALSLLDRGIEQLADPALRGMCNLRKGKLLLKMGKPAEGIALLRGFVAAQSTNAPAHEVQLELAQTLLDNGLPDKALLDFQNYLETFADPAGATRAQHGKGMALFNLGRYNEAAAAFEKAGEGIQSPLEKANNRLYVGNAHVAAGQYKLAIESYARIQTQWPETPLADQAEFQIAECWARLGEPARAETLFWDLADKDPCGELTPAALLRIADLELMQGRADTARSIYTDISRTYPDPSRSRALHGLGLIEYRADQFGAALNYFELAYSACPTGDVADRAMYLCAWCRFRLGQDEQAVTAFRTFVQRYPDSIWAPDALFWVSEYEYNHGRYGPAETGFLTAARRYPKGTIADAALFWAGRAALMQNEFRRANNHFALLIKEYPSSSKRPEARFYQAVALCELGKFAEAILIFDDLIKQFPDHELNETAWFRKGDCQFTLGTEDPKRYNEALSSYQTILDRPAVTPGARLQAEYKIGRCLEKAGSIPDAFEHYMNVVYLYYKTTDHRPDDSVWFTRSALQAAALMEAEKSWRKAAAIYQRIVDADVPSSAEAQERINRLHSEHWLNFY